MCYAIPGRVIAIEDHAATIEYYGESRRAHNELPELKIGDYVYAQGGFVLEILSEATAMDILAAWKDIFRSLQETDRKLSGRMPDTGDSHTRRILDRAVQDKTLGDDELLHLLGLPDKEADLLYGAANFLRHKHQANSCCVHGIIELSNTCRYGCQYCGISRLNTGLRRYRMTLPEILESVEAAVVVHGFKALVLQGGQGAYTIPELEDIVRTIRSRYPVLVFVSFGEMSREALGRLHDAGARGLLLRFETSNPERFRTVHPDSTLDTRVQVLRDALSLGYLIVTGGLIGWPGQTDADILSDIRLAQSLKAEMYSFGPFLPHPGTPMGHLDRPDETKVLNTLAVTRLLDPANGKILVTTALETLSPASARKALLAGANTVMLNATPIRYRSLYELYPGRAHADDSIPDQIRNTLALLKDIGRAPTDLGTGIQ